MDAAERNDYENFKFGGTGPDNAYVKTFDQGGFLSGVEYDNIAATYPDTVTEVYTYKLVAVTVATITVIYTDASKKYLVSVVRS